MTEQFGMKRLLLAMLPWMVATAAYGQSRTAQVVYTYHEPLKEAVYRVADECYAPVFAVGAWGWKIQLNRDSVDLTADDKKANVPVRTVGGRQTIPLKLALEKMGASLEWDEESNTLYAKGIVNTIKVVDGKLQIGSTLPVKTSVFAMDNPPRLVIDIKDAKLLNEAVVDIPQNARFKQFKPDVVRVVLETADAPKLVAQATDDATSLLALTLDPNAASSITKSVEVPAQDPKPDEEKPKTDLAPEDPQIIVDLDSERSMLILIRGVGELNGPVQFRKNDPLTLDVILPGVHLKLPEGFKLNSDSILSTLSVEGETFSVVRFNLTRPMNADVTSGNGEVRIQLAKPLIRSGTGLAGKVVVVDAGHGGHDTGARSGGVLEKNLTLAIAKKTAAALSDAGATVIMTRESDVFIPLDERANIANRNAADIFVSIHINSNKVANSFSGTITFHHKGSDSGETLAECVQAEISKVNKLPSVGVWSDGKIYQSGFAVLRNTQMPGVLIELGFINHFRDRARMQQAEFQNGIASAVVKALKVYLGDG